MFDKKLLYLYFGFMLCFNAAVNSAAHQEPPLGALPAVAPYAGSLRTLGTTVPVRYMYATPFDDFEPNYAPVHDARARAYEQGRNEILIAAGILTVGSNAGTLSNSLGLSLMASAAAGAAHEIITTYDNTNHPEDILDLSVLTGNMPWTLLYCKHFGLWHGVPDYVGYKAQCDPALIPVSGEDNNEIPTPAQRTMLLNYMYNDLLPQRAAIIGRSEGRKAARSLTITTGILVGGLEYLTSSLKSLFSDT